MPSPGASPGRRSAWARCLDPWLLGDCANPLPCSGMQKKKLASVAIAALLGGCAITPPAPLPSAAQTLDGYKRDVAKRIAAANAESYSAPLPEVMKSIVVLEITVDGLGAPLKLSVYRSNGYPVLAQR